MNVFSSDISRGFVTFKGCNRQWPCGKTRFCCSGPMHKNIVYPTTRHGMDMGISTTPRWLTGREREYKQCGILIHFWKIKTISRDETWSPQAPAAIPTAALVLVAVHRGGTGASATSSDSVRPKAKPKMATVQSQRERRNDQRSRNVLTPNLGSSQRDSFQRKRWKKMDVQFG